MGMQKYADEIKNNPKKKLNVFSCGISGKKNAAGLTLVGAATMFAGGVSPMKDATDGRPGERAVEMNVAHVVGLLAMTAGGAVAMKEGAERIANEAKEDKKTKKLSPQDLVAAKAGRSM